MCNLNCSKYNLLTLPDPMSVNTEKRTGCAIATAYANLCDPLLLDKYRYIEEINCCTINYQTRKLFALRPIGPPMYTFTTAISGQNYCGIRKNFGEFVISQKVLTYSIFQQLFSSAICGITQM